MEKRAYYLELPDKDLALLLMDDGEKQEILTTSPNVPDVWFDFMQEKGFEVRGFRRTYAEYENENGEIKRYSSWYAITGDLIRIGTHSGLLPSRSAYEEEEAQDLTERPGRYKDG